MRYAHDRQKKKTSIRLHTLLIGSLPGFLLVGHRSATKSTHVLVRSKTGAFLFETLKLIGVMLMEYADLKKLYEIFIKGIELDSQARERLLGQECGDDEKLRAQALLLLKNAGSRKMT